MPNISSLSDKDIIDQIVEARRESFEARRVKDGWSRRAWNWYNNIHDWSKKDDWQSRLALPKFAMAIDQATNFMRQSMRKSTRLFGIEVLNDDPVDRLLAGFFGAVMHEVIREMMLPQQFVDGLKVALITNQAIHKVGYDVTAHPELAPALVEEEVTVKDSAGTVIESRVDQQYQTQEVERTVAMPSCTLINPTRYYPDPRGLKLYEVNEQFKDLYWVLEKFDGVAATKVLNELVADQATSGPPPEQESQDIDERAQQEIIEPENAWRRVVKLTDYWGPLFTRDGKMVAKRVRVVLANDKHILIRGEPYPYWDGRSPFVVYQGLSVPFSVWGKLLVQHVDSIQLYTNELASLMIDKAKMSALSPLAIDVNLLDDVEDILTGMFPGKIFKTRGPKAVEELQMRGVGVDHFQMLGMLGQEGQNAHGVTEFLQGLPSTRGRATATEVEEKTVQGAEFFNGILQQANDGMEQVFEKVYFRIMQFKDDWSDVAVQKIAERFGMAQYIAQMNPVERYNLMKRPFRFHAAGLNAAIRRSEILKNITDLMTVMGNFGPAALQQLPIDKLMGQIIEAFDMSELLNTPASAPNVIIPGPGDQAAGFNPPQLEAGALPGPMADGVQQRLKGAPSPTGPQ